MAAPAAAALRQIPPKGQFLPKTLKISVLGLLPDARGVEKIHFSQKKIFSPPYSHLTPSESLVGVPAPKIRFLDHVPIFSPQDLLKFGLAGSRRARTKFQNRLKRVRRTPFATPSHLLEPPAPHSVPRASTLKFRFWRQHTTARPATRPPRKPKIQKAADILCGYFFLLQILKRYTISPSTCWICSKFFHRPEVYPPSPLNFTS